MLTKVLEKVLDKKGLVLFMLLHLLVFIQLTMVIYFIELTDTEDIVNAALLLYPVNICVILYLVYMKHDTPED